MASLGRASTSRSRPVLAEVQARVEDVVGERGDDDPAEADVELAQRARHQVVGDRPVGGDAGDLERDRVGLVDADPDREIALGALLLEDHNVLSGRHMDPDAVDRDLDQTVDSSTS